MLSVCGCVLVAVLSHSRRRLGRQKRAGKETEDVEEVEEAHDKEEDRLAAHAEAAEKQNSMQNLRNKTGMQVDVDPEDAPERAEEGNSRESVVPHLRVAPAGGHLPPPDPLPRM